MSSGSLPRRTFVASSLLGAATLVPRHVLGGAGEVPPSEKIRLAHIGMGTQGFRELKALLDHPAVEITAVCDPNTDSNDYLEWGAGEIRGLIGRLVGDPNWRATDGCPGGREVGRFVVEAYYSNQRGKPFRGCRAYADFRELLEKEADLDAVKVMTPDHLHAAIAVAAMNRGKHVLMHKPLANRMTETRKVLETAAAAGKATHLLAYGAGPGNARIAAAVKKGVIGRLREIHNWSNRPVWPQYAEIPRDRPPVPPGLQWDLWLGPAVDRPYHPCYTHTVFRGWYDFGGGSMADMGIYSLWPVFEQLGLGPAVVADGWGTHLCTTEKTVCRVIHNDYSYPAGCTFRFGFAPGSGGEGLELWWYDGGMKPRLPAALDAAGVRPAPEGILFVGESGAVLAGFLGQNPILFAEGKQTPLEQVLGEEFARAVPDRGSHLDLWVAACRGGEASPGNFLSASAVSQTVNLGTIALRCGSRVEYDPETGRLLSPGGAASLLTREYRPGWEL
ncbi:MAG: Gfo/Idh/MocA family oxidoreductase [Thermogutta sp.]|nr:Gfo/Idh/MocA family oxidoreductase [Thermogutta sp.]